ncbi:hypothetical protein ABTP79_18770, partial [Acinetobacter baumannii]
LVVLVALLALVTLDEDFTVGDATTSETASKFAIATEEASLKVTANCRLILFITFFLKAMLIILTNGRTSGPADRTHPDIIARGAGKTPS